MTGGAGVKEQDGGDKPGEERKRGTKYLKTDSDRNKGHDGEVWSLFVFEGGAHANVQTVTQHLTHVQYVCVEE